MKCCEYGPRSLIFTRDLYNKLFTAAINFQLVSQCCYSHSQFNGLNKHTSLLCYVISFMKGRPDLLGALSQILDPTEVCGSIIKTDWPHSQILDLAFCKISLQLICLEHQRFITFTPGCNVIKLFTALSYKFL